MKKQTKEEIEREHMKLIRDELRMFGAPISPLKHTGRGGYLGHGKSDGHSDYKPDEDKQYRPNSR